MTAQNIAAAIVSKLSLGTMGIKGGVILAQPETVKSMRVATFYGKVGGYKTVEDKTTSQIHHPVTGNFVGVNHVNEDKEYQSGILYLPAGIHDQLLDASKKLMDESETIDFALEVSVVRSSNAAGFSYEAKPLIKPVAVDPLEEIRKQLPGYKALTAPAPVAQIDAPKTAATPAAAPAKVAEPAKTAAKK